MAFINEDKWKNIKHQLEDNMKQTRIKIIFCLRTLYKRIQRMRSTMRIYLIILMCNMSIGCSENKGNQNELDWRDEYGIIEGTGIVAGEVILEDGRWENDTVYVYLQDPVLPETHNQTRYCVGIDTITATSGYFMIKNVPSGDYAIITTNNRILIKDKVIEPFFQNLISFRGGVL